MFIHLLCLTIYIKKVKSLSRVRLFVDYSLPHSFIHGIFPGKSTGAGCHCLLQSIFPNPGIEPGSPTLWADTWPSEPPGSPRWVQASVRSSGINHAGGIPTAVLVCKVCKSSAMLSASRLRYSSFSLRKRSQCCVKNFFLNQVFFLCNYFNN